MQLNVFSGEVFYLDHFHICLLPGQIQRVDTGHVPNAASPGERTRGRPVTYLGDFYRGIRR